MRVDTNQTPTDDAKLSLHALSGIQCPSTMRITTHINNNEVSLLVDNESFHNFINPSIMQQVGLKSMATDPFDVKVANDERLTC